MTSKTALDMKSEKLTIEVISTPNQSMDAWENVRDILADCFINLLQEEVKENINPRMKERENGHKRTV